MNVSQRSPHHFREVKSSFGLSKKRSKIATRFRGTRDELPVTLHRDADLRPMYHSENTVTRLIVVFSTKSCQSTHYDSYFHQVPSSPTTFAPTTGYGDCQSARQLTARTSKNLGDNDNCTLVRGREHMNIRFTTS